VSALPPAPPPPRSPWQRLYGAALAARARRLAARAERLPAAVVSIGNLAWGGAGKTPFVAALCERLAGAGRRVAILSRGYGRRSRGALVVSRGAGPEVELDLAGDEPFELARALPGVAVVVGERRAEAGRLALASLAPGPDLFLLDDGFSHAALARDLDLLLFPFADPWAGGRLLPAGRLREPLAAAARAAAAIVTGAPEDALDEAAAALGRDLARFGFGGASFASATAALPARLGSGEPLAPEVPLFAVAAIARPASFFATCEGAGLRLVGRLALRDHARYAPGDLARIARAARAAGAAAVVTTAKDRAKLERRLDLPLAVLPVVARPGARFWAWLDARLAELQR
jgi:tetraacyldisaccharide 4'-kinase